MRTHWTMLLILLAFLLLGCGSALPSEDEPAVPNPLSSPSEATVIHTPENPLQSANTSRSQEMSKTPPPVEKFVSLAKKDLADRLQIDIAGIVLKKTAEMVWPNSALGCPSPGKVYPAGKVPGFQISLVTGNVEYVYNTDWTGQVVLCLKQGPDGSLEPVTTVGPEIGVPIK